MRPSSNTTDYSLGIINPSDILKGVRGGSTGFIKSILPYFNTSKVTIFGMGFNGTIPWKCSNINSNTRFIPICDIAYPSRIPLRLTTLLYYTYYRNRILNSGVDVLYIHSPECCLPFLFLNRDIPVIYHQHGSANPVIRSKYAYGRNKLFLGIFENISKLIYKKADWIIAIDRLCLEQAVQNGAANKTSLTMNAIDTELFKTDPAAKIEIRNRLGIDEDHYAILFVGRIEQPKGAGRLLECIPFLNAKGLNFHIFLVGDGTYKGHLENYVIQNRFETQVTFLGLISHDKLPLYYNMADVLVLPSEIEGVPMVILEALACGTPVVASNVGGIPDLIADQTNGIILDDLSPEKLANAVHDVIHLNTTRKQIRQSVADQSAAGFVSGLDKIIYNLFKLR